MTQKMGPKKGYLKWSPDFLGLAFEGDSASLVILVDFDDVSVEKCAVFPDENLHPTREQRGATTN